MPPPPAAKRWAPPLAPLLLAALAGCQTHPPKSPRDIPRASDAELAQASALAWYAVGHMLASDAANRGAPLPDAALDAFAEAGRLDPAVAVPSVTAALLLAGEKRPEEALQLLERHARHARAPAHALHQLGLRAERMGRPLLAINAQTRALDSPGLPESLRLPVVTSLVRACMAAGRDTQAIRVMRREALSNPGRAEGMRALAEAWARSLAQSADHVRAANMAGFAATLAGSRAAFASAKRLEASALDRAGKPREAEKIWLRLLAPPDGAAVPAAIDLGRFYARGHDTNAVLKIRSRAPAASPVIQAVVAAAALAEWGRPGAAQKILSHACPPGDPGAFPASAQFHLFYGNILLEANNVADAARLARLAIQRYPNTPDIQNLFNRAMALAKESLGEVEEVLKILE